MFFSNQDSHPSFIFFSLFLLCFLFMFLPSSHAEISLDGSLGPQMALSGPDYQIKAEYGRIINSSNLFHSFEKFNIDTGQSAAFSGPDAILNVIGRVTGGSLSNIDGLIRSEFPSANLYLMNPSGFLFGPNARLDVNGSFHLSTSDYIILGNEGVFYANPAKESMLTVDPPSAFGFLSSNPGPITITESQLEVPEGKTLSLMGGNLQITGVDTDNLARVIAPGGRIDMASVSSPGEIVPDYDAGTPGLTTVGVDTFGNIDLNHTRVDSGGNGGGTVFIRGGRLTSDSSYIYASTKGESQAVPGAGIDIQVSGDMVVDNSSGTDSVIGTNIFNNINADSGGVRIIADRLEIKNGGVIQSVSFPGSNGLSGDIQLNAQTILVQDTGHIESGSGGSGKGGDIFINTVSLEIKDAAFIYSNVFDGTGNGGNININAESILLSNEKYPGAATGIIADTHWPGEGTGGDITINTIGLEMFPATEISTPTFYLGQGGNIKIDIEGDAYIEGSKDGTPSGDWIYTGIFANSFWSGNGGNVEINASNLKLATAASIGASPFSTGSAGNIVLNTDGLELIDASYISSFGLYGGGGDCGNIKISADYIQLSGPESSIDPFNADFTGISSISGASGGNGGDIDIQTPKLEMTNRSMISSSSWGPGIGGDIKIATGKLQILKGSSIIANAFGSGDAGMVRVDAHSILVSGVHPESYFHPSANEELLAPSAIGSQAGLNGGNGGNLNLTTTTLELLDGGSLLTDTFGAGNAGNINIVSDQVLVSGENPDLKDFYIKSGTNPDSAVSQIAAGSSSLFIGDLATGSGGNITINTSDIRMTEHGTIKSESTSLGKAGNINIIAGSTFFSDNASLLTSSEQSLGGDINVQANQMTLLNNTTISAQSSGQGDAGSIYLRGQDRFLMDASNVTTEAKQADGGNIKVYSDYMVYLVDSEITASVGGGADTTGGNISIDPRYVILKNSKIKANAFQGKGGNIEIVSDVFLADPDSVLDASSSLGIDGQVDIRSPVTHVSSLVSPLSKDFRSVVALLREPCLARVHKGEYSSFLIKGRDSLPMEPGRFLSSPLSLR